MIYRVLWSAVALASLIYSSGCCCGPCGDGCGGLGLDLGGRFNDCETGCPGSAGQRFCGRGCGDVYWGEFSAQRCDSCDCDGNFTGRCCAGPCGWLVDCWEAFWGCTSCNSCNSGCDGGCFGGGRMGECCNDGLLGGRWGSRHHYDAGMPRGGCSCGHSHGSEEGHVIETQSPTPAAKRYAPPMKETEPNPDPPKPSSTSYRPSRQAVVTVAPASPRGTTMRATTSSRVQQVQYQSGERVAMSPARSAATTTRTAAAPLRMSAEKTMSSRPPMTAQDFDLPPGAQIIKIEDN